MTQFYKHSNIRLNDKYAQKRLKKAQWSLPISGKNEILLRTGIKPSGGP